MEDFDKKRNLRPDHTYLNPGALGCYIGHMEFYKRCFEQNLNYAIAFEDNVILLPSFKQELNEALKIIPSDFDMCFLHTFSFIEDPNFNNTEQLKKIIWSTSCKCYLINVQRMKKYYPLFFPISMHVDRIYERLAYEGCNIYYTPLNKSIKFLSTNSTIGHTGVVDHNNFFYYTNLNDNMIKSISGYLDEMI